MYHPKISIITVVYNRVNKLEQLISSVINQSYDNIEFIIVDGASTDGTIDVIKKYESKISKWISEPDTGIYNAMNKGVRIATGDYVEIIGSDDALVGKNAIASIVQDLYDMPDILSCLQYMVYPKEKRQVIYSNHFARDKRAYKGGMVGHAAMFAKRELFDKYPFDEKYRIASDYKFFLQCYFDSSIHIKYTDKFVAFFEVDSEGASDDIAACWEEDSQIYKELNLPFDDARRTKEMRSIYKKLVIKIADRIGLTERLSRINKIYINGGKHVCENEICRWCGRYKDCK